MPKYKNQPTTRLDRSQQNGVQRRILGIDPGLRSTGFGVIAVDDHRLNYLASGIIRLPDGSLPERLVILFEQLSNLVAEHEPTVAAIEQVFVHRNPSSALKLGHARGAAICACASGGLVVTEYTPRAIKLALVGTGGAGKDQVQYMVRHLLGLGGTLRADAADALAAAVCHVHRHRLDNTGIG